MWALDGGSPVWHVYFKKWQCCMSLSLIFPNVACRILAKGMSHVTLIRGFPDHATYREKGAKLACADKLGVFLSLTLCNKAKFDPLHRVKYDGL